MNKNKAKNGFLGLLLFSLMQSAFAATVGITAGDSPNGSFAGTFRGACVFNDSNSDCTKTSGAYNCTNPNLPEGTSTSISTGASPAKNVCYQLTLYPNDYNTTFSFDGSCEGLKTAPSISSGGNEVFLTFYTPGKISGNLILSVTLVKMAPPGTPGYIVKCQFN